VDRRAGRGQTLGRRCLCLQRNLHHAVRGGRLLMLGSWLLRCRRCLLPILSGVR
jgi:hypothetical protein